METENIILLVTYLFVVVGVFSKKHSSTAIFGIGASNAFLTPNWISNKRLFAYWNPCEYCLQH